MQRGFGQGGDLILGLVVCQRRVSAGGLLYATYLVQLDDKSDNTEPSRCAHISDTMTSCCKRSPNVCMMRYPRRDRRHAREPHISKLQLGCIERSLEHDLGRFQNLNGRGLLYKRRMMHSVKRA
jgi:hypothetical protein